MIGEKEARLHAKMSRYKRMKDLANRIITEALEQCEAPFVSCSFGKDSGAMLHLVMQHLPNINVRFIRWPETDMIDNFPEVISQWKAMGANVVILDLWRPTLDHKVAGRWEMLNRMGHADGYFIGLRKDESVNRRIILSKQGRIHRLKNGMLRICPLAEWNTLDVAAYTVEHNLPMLSAYQKRGFEERTASRIPRDAYSIRENALRQIRNDDPAAWQKLQELYPEVTQWT